MVACRDHAGLGSIEEGAIGHADDIAAYDLVFCIAVAFIDGRLNAGVNFFNGDFLSQDGDQFGQGAGEGGNALCSAVQLTFQRR